MTFGSRWLFDQREDTGLSVPSGSGGSQASLSMDVLFGNSGMALGKKVDGFGRVELTEPGRSTWITGSHGTGKSMMLRRLILRDIREGQKSILVLDPHGDLGRDIIGRCGADPRTIYFSPTEQAGVPFGLNVFELSRPEEYHKKVEAIMSSIEVAFYGPGSMRRMPVMRVCVDTAVRALIAAHATHQTHFYHFLLALSDGPEGDYWRQELARLSADNPVVAQKLLSWQKTRHRQEDTKSTLNKVEHFLNSPILQHTLCQPTTSAPFRFREFTAQRGVLICDLSGLDEESQRLLGSFILTQLISSAYLRRPGERVPTAIYADEFHRFAVSLFSQVIFQLRKFGVHGYFANQSLAQLDDEARAAVMSVGNVCAFRVGPQDARALAPLFSQEGKLPEVFLSEIDLYTCLCKVASGESSEIGYIQAFPDKTPENPAMAAAAIERSKAYGRPRERVERAIQQLA